MQEFPNDEDGAVLKLLHDNGVDLSKAINIEFAVHSPDEAASKTIEQAMIAKGYNAEIFYDEGELEEGEEVTPENEEFAPSWSVYTEISMIPEHGEILRIQKELDDISLPFGGKSDGWGVLN
jgi:hypothetical protein